jgi:hypothetical protein
MPMSMSAADWTRMQRRRAGIRYVDEDTAGKIVAPVAFPAILNVRTDLRDIGTSKSRKTAGDWTNYVAGELEDYVLKSQGSGRVGETGENNDYTTQKVNRICSCTSVIRLPKQGICGKCSVAQRLRS